MLTPDLSEGTLFAACGNKVMAIVDSKTGKPIVNDESFYHSQSIPIAPGPGGAHNWSPMSFNPATGFYYFSALERCNNFSPRHGEWQAGRGYMGGAARPAP